MKVLSKAPNVVVVCATIIVVCAIAGVTILIALGRNADEVTHIINIILNGLAVFASGGALLYAGAGAKSGEVVEKRLNGELDARIRKSVHQALMSAASDARVADAQPEVNNGTPIGA